MNKKKKVLKKFLHWVRYFIFNMSSSDEEQPPKPPSIFTDEQLAELEESFEIFDKDKDGKITVPEMEPLMHAIGLAYDKSELEEFCARNDQTGSGQFKFDEFLKVAEHFREQVNMEEQLLKAFKAFLDHEDDTRMRDSVFFKILTSYGTPFTPEEIKHLQYLIHKDDGPNASDEEFIILDFIRMILAPKQENEDDD